MCKYIAEPVKTALIPDNIWMFYNMVHSTPLSGQFFLTGTAPGHLKGYHLMTYVSMYSV